MSAENSSSVLSEFKFSLSDVSASYSSESSVDDGKDMDADFASKGRFAISGSSTGSTSPDARFVDLVLMFICSWNLVMICSNA